MGVTIYTTKEMIEMFEKDSRGKHRTVQPDSRELTMDNDLHVIRPAITKDFSMKKEYSFVGRPITEEQRLRLRDILIRAREEDRK